MLRIAEVRKSRGLLQEDVAKEIGIDRSTVAKWETGKAKPKADTLLALSTLFNCSIDELLGNEIRG